MKIFHEETSLVLAGAWNPAILTPAWVLQNGLNKELDGTNRYQTFLPTGLGLVFDAPRYVLEDLTFSVRTDSLIITPNSETLENLAFVEATAARMLEQLRHTPMGGVGHNFEFREQNPQPAQLDVFTRSREDLADNMPGGWEPTKSAILTSFSNTARTVVINMHRVLDGDMILVKVNFHHAVASVEQAISVLRGENGYSHMAQNFELARNLLTSIYGDLEIE